VEERLKPDLERRWCWTNTRLSFLLTDALGTGWANRGRLIVSSKEHCDSTFTFILPYKVSTSCDNFDDPDELSDVDGNEDDTTEGFFQNQKGLVQLRMHLQLLLMLLRCMNQQVHQIIALKRRMKVHFNRARTTYHNCSGVPKKMSPMASVLTLAEVEKALYGSG